MITYNSKKGKILATKVEFTEAGNNLGPGCSGMSS